MVKPAGTGNPIFHLGETCALAAEEIAPCSIAFRFARAEKIHPFFHCTPRLSFFDCGTLAAIAIPQRWPKKMSTRRLYISSSNTLDWLSPLLTTDFRKIRD